MHALGPWTVGNYYGSPSNFSRVRRVALKGAGGQLVAMAHSENTEEVRANARLIAAAPELRNSLSEALTALAAAREMLGVFEDNGGHDGLSGKGYRATLDGIDRATTAGLAALEKSK
jgi:hypothetical protein